MKPKRHEDQDFIDYVKATSFCIPHVGKCSEPIEVHHLKSVGSGGGDYDWNCLPTCRAAHQNIHAIGLTKACLQYPALKRYLVIFNWEFDTFKQKWSHYGKAEADEELEPRGAPTTDGPQQS